VILFISDVHGRFELINAQTAHAELWLERPVDAVVLAGDLGLFEPHLSSFFRKQRQRFLRPFYFIEGNHEDFDALDVLVRRYADVMTHLPRGTLWEIAGHKVLALGGVSYMDALNTPRASLLNPADIARCLEHPPGAAEVLVTHDCPCGIGMANSPTYGHLGPPGFAGSRELLAHLRPPTWVFGHFHRRFEACVADTRFFGLPMGWHGYALLHDDGRFEYVDHSIPAPPGWWERIKQRWLGRTSRRQ